MLFRSYTLKTYLGSLSDTTLTLYGTDGTTFLLYNDDDGATLASSITWTAPAAGTYYLQVAGFSVGVGSYNVAVLAATGIDGDFNDDGNYDCADINALTAAIAGGANNAAYDLTGDTLVNVADRDAWLAEAGAANLASGNAYILGDANLDGNVDGSDFNIWNGHKFTAATAWCSGNFNADANVDGSDFNIWNGHKFTSALRPGDPGTVPNKSDNLARAVVATLPGTLALRMDPSVSSMAKSPTSKIGSPAAEAIQAIETVKARGTTQSFATRLASSPSNNRSAHASIAASSRTLRSVDDLFAHWNAEASLEA